jgi:hypothetical protein
MHGQRYVPARLCAKVQYAHAQGSSSKTTVQTSSTVHWVTTTLQACAALQAGVCACFAARVRLLSQQSVQAALTYEVSQAQWPHRLVGSQPHALVYVLSTANTLAAAAVAAAGEVSTSISWFTAGVAALNTWTHAVAAADSQLTNSAGTVQAAAAGPPTTHPRAFGTIASWHHFNNKA